MDRLLSGLFRLAGRTPPPVVDSFCRVVGGLWFRLDRRHRNIALGNLRIAFGNDHSEAEYRCQAESAFQNLLHIPFETGYVAHASQKGMRPRFRFFGKDHFDQAALQGRGVLALTAHVGNWEILTAAAELAGIPLHVLYRPLDFRPLDSVLNRMRSRYGAVMIPTYRAMRRILTTLSAKGVVAILMDQNVDWYEGVYVDFFHQTACTNKGMAILALRTRAPVVPVFLVRENGMFRVEFFPAIPLISTGDNTHDIEANTRQYNQAIETIVRRYPHQWFWVHQRWKTRNFCKWNPVSQGSGQQPGRAA